MAVQICSLACHLSWVCPYGSPWHLLQLITRVWSMDTERWHTRSQNRRPLRHCMLLCMNLPDYAYVAWANTLKHTIFPTSSVDTCFQLDSPSGLLHQLPTCGLWMRMLLSHPHCALLSSTSFGIMAYDCSGHLIIIMKTESPDSYPVCNACLLDGMAWHRLCWILHSISVHAIYVHAMLTCT